MKRFFHFLFFICLLNISSVQAQQTGKITIVVPDGSHPRVNYAADRLGQALKAKGYKVTNLKQNTLPSGGSVIVLGNSETSLLQKAQNTSKIAAAQVSGKEGFSINSSKGNIVIAGNDNSGTLYGALDLIDKIKAEGKLPATLHVNDKPEMVLRG